MCLVIKNIKTRELARIYTKNPKIAKKDVNVFKVLDENNNSAYQYFKYEKGTHYYQTGRPFSFEIYKQESVFNYGWRININRGLHSFTLKKAAKEILYPNDKIVKMVIPRGSKYYISSDGTEIVSDNLIYY